jgi:geranylgeranyl reductase family protein
MDVAVVGAGPAGAGAACRLARAGARVTIFDSSHPREKPCGGGVTGRAHALVRDVLENVPAGATTIRTARFVDSRSGRQTTVALDAGALFVSDRSAFDGALLDAAVRAGATHVKSRVVHVAASPSIEVRTREATYTADFLIGADGAAGVTRRMLGRPFTRAQLSIAAGCFVHGVTSDEIVVEIVADPPGYLWSFPRANHLAVGVCAQADGDSAATDLQQHAARWIDAAGLAPADRRVSGYSWPIPSLGPAEFSRQTIAGARWCLAGDAAGLVDPITREGIYFAVASGGWAAAAIAGGGNAMREYKARVDDEAAAELTAAARLKAGFFRPSFSALLFEGLERSSRIRAVMADLIAGTQSYRTLKWRLLNTFEIGLAGRALRTLTLERKA